MTDIIKTNQEPEPAKTYYSATTRGFYNSTVHETMPDDVVEITAEQHVELLEAQAQGKTIVPDKKGWPVAIIYKPTADELKEIAVQKAIGDLAATDNVFIRCGKAGVKYPQAWIDYTTALREVVSTGGESTYPTRPAYPSGS